MDANSLLAALPIVTVLGLMLAARQSAARAGLAGSLVALAVAVAWFGLGTRVLPEVGLWRATLGVLLEAAFTSATILWIIFPALSIYHLQRRAGSFDVLRRAIGGLSSDRVLVGILIGWFFALFMEGAAGFGTPVALVAPLLVSLGFQPLVAVTVAMIGHAVGVSFGAVGTPVTTQAELTGLDLIELSRANAWLHVWLGWTLLVLLSAMVLRAEAAEAGGTRRPSVWLWTAAAALLFFLPFFALARWIGPELPTLAGALAGGTLYVAALVAARRLAARRRAAPSNDARTSPRELLWAASTYLVLVALILLTRLVPPLEERLAQLEFRWQLWDAFTGRFAPLYHPGSLLMAALGLSVLLRGDEPRVVGAALADAGRQLTAVALALVAMLFLSRLMVHAEMIDALAGAAARTLGAAWPLAAPLVGVLGTFVTGSATASNVLFAGLQQATAERLQLPPAAIVGTHGFGAAIGNIVAPHNLVAGAATVGLTGREAEILRRTFLPCLAYATLGGLVAWLVLR